MSEDSKTRSAAGVRNWPSEAEERWIARWKRHQERSLLLRKSRRTDPEICGAKNRELLRSLWKDEAVLLRELSLFWSQNGGPLDGFASGLLFDLSTILEDLGAGHVSVLIDAARNSGGGAPRLRTERGLLAPAVYFLRGVDNGTVQSPRPVAAVSEAYDVSKVTVRAWRKNGDEIIEGIRPAHPNLLESSMEYAGIRYQANRAQSRSKPNS